jgi:hypothetical protein
MIPHSASLVELQVGIVPIPQHASPFVHAVIMLPFTQRASQLSTEPMRLRSWHPMAGQDVGQASGPVPVPSHSSSPSLTPLPQSGWQSLSLVALQRLAGQQPSSFLHMFSTPAATHWALQVPGMLSVNLSQTIMGQLMGQVESGSHCSPVSTRSLPQTAPQSTSMFAAVWLQPPGQQLSEVRPEQATGVTLQRALHRSGLPVYRRTSGQSLDGQLSGSGQVPGGSQVSPELASTTPSPHAAQSLSVSAVQPIGQHWSLPAVEQVLGVFVHLRLQVAAAPVLVSVVQLFWSSHTGHDPGGSQVSPISTAPFPQTAGQSASRFICEVLQPGGQQPSEVELEQTAISVVHSALQLAALPV